MPPDSVASIQANPKYYVALDPPAPHTWIWRVNFKNEYGANKKVRVFDLSADFRLRDGEAYKTWYGHAHEALGLQARAVYGLTEHARAEISRTDLVACPGCYPTAVQLARLSLWLTTLAADRPLTFLAHHLRVGDSLCGTWLSRLRTPPPTPFRRSLAPDSHPTTIVPGRSRPSE